MIENLYVDIGYQSLTKDGEFVCGDHVETLRQSDGSVVLVLADGLGSGVKACILSTLTSTILARMAAAKLDITYCVRAIAEALPMCSVRKLAYSTFTMLHISPTGKALIVQYDNPCIALIRDGQEVPLAFSRMTVDDKTVESASVQLQKGDVLLTFSDGAENAGVAPGRSYALKWGRDEIIRYIEPLCLAGYSAKTLNTIVLDECYRRYEAMVGDDTTALTICMRTREQVNVGIGPPANLEDNEKMMSLFFSKGGRHVICGGTTSRIASEFLGKPLRPVPRQADDDIPAGGSIEGVDLVTEGILTVNRVLDYARDYLRDNETYSQWCFKRDCASTMARMLFEEATDVNFFVGRAVNPAHQDPDLSISFEIKMRIIRDLADCLVQMGKTVRINYF